MKRLSLKSVALIWVGSLLFLVTGCNNEKHSDLKKYIASVKQRPAAPVEPIPQVKTYPKHAYDGKGLRDPFRPISNPRKLNGDPTGERAKERLEAYPLDSLRMVGILVQGQVTWALIKAPDGIVDKVAVGGYLGQNYGKVTAISGSGLSLTETIALGESWVKRQAELALVKEENDREK